MDDECNRDTCKHRKNEIYANCFCSLQESFSSGENDGGGAKFNEVFHLVACIVVVTHRNGHRLVNDGIVPHFQIAEAVKGEMTDSDR